MGSQIRLLKSDGLPKRRGRPNIHGFSSAVAVRITKEERALVDRVAARLGMNISDLLRAYLAPIIQEWKRELEGGQEDD